MRSNSLSEISGILASMPEYQQLIRKLNKKSFDIFTEFLPEGSGHKGIQRPHR